MAFEISRVDNDTFAALLTEDVVRQVRDLVFMPDDWATFHNDHPVAVDHDRRCVLLYVSSADKLNAGNFYLFLQQGEFALMEQRAFNTYSFNRASPSLRTRREQVVALISEALRVGGVFVDGNPDNLDIFTVSDARFLN